MPSIISSTYLSRNPIERATANFARRFEPHQRILDIGCGTKPYKKFFKCEYIGTDPIASLNPEIVGQAWSIAAPNHSFDGIILNQSLEHIQKTTETIQEIKRLLKPGGLCLITVPQAMKNHGLPLVIEKSSQAGKYPEALVPYWQEDYYRFTKYGLLALFSDFHLETIKETSGYVGTIAQLINYFFASFGKWKWLFIPIFLINNVIGSISDTLFLWLARVGPAPCNKFYQLIYSSLPLNYILIIKNPDSL